MRELPRPFVGEMVRAILDNRKKQTRRVIIPQPTRGFNTVSQESWGWVFHSNHDNHYHIKSKYQVGDRLYVREKARLIETLEGGACGIVTGIGDDNKARFRYEADGYESDWIIYPERLAALQVGECVARGCYKEAARIWLEITGIRVERVRNIDENGACAEGCKLYTPETNLGAERTFQRLWDSLNAKRGYGWDKNPWVWVIEFKKENGEGDDTRGKKTV